MAAMAACTLACAAQDFKDVQYTVSGKLPAETTVVYLAKEGGRSYSDTIAVQNGTFQYTGTGMQYSIVTAVANTGESMRFFCDETPVTLDLAERQLTGSDLNALFGQCQKEDDAAGARLKVLFEQMTAASSSDATDKDSRLAELQKQYEGVMQDFASSIISIMKANTGNFLPTAYLDLMQGRMSLEDMRVVLDQNAPYYNYPSRSVSRAKYALACMEKRLPGTPFTDIAIPDFDGKPHQLGEWCGKGQYVLLDFWASWCGPCRKEMPNVVANYAKYHEKGFEIIGISLDNSVEPWKKAVQDLGMTWPQLSNLKAWQSAGVAEYGVMAVPSCILLDGEGRIVASDLRGEDLGNKLKEIYGF